MLQDEPDTIFIFAEKQEVVTVYLCAYCKQIDTLLATIVLLLYPAFSATWN